VEAIKKITLYPAERFGIKNKGSIAEGYDADLVVFDLDAIVDRADYVSRGNSNEPPAGIDCVIVNGMIAAQNGAITKNRNAGRMIENLEGVGKEISDEI
jgi:N-acyl-D-amino-acid deacylase